MAEPASGSSDRRAVLLPALFEEANRMQRFTSQLRRALDARGIATVVPQLAGQGESLVPLEAARLADWLESVAQTVAGWPHPILSIAIRGGALLDRIADHRWRLAPESGARLLRDMVRATALSAGLPASEIDRRARAEPTRLLGNLMAPTLYAALADAAPEGSAHVPELQGQRLWRAAEPGEDAALLAAAVEDVTAWAAQCAAN